MASSEIEFTGRHGRFGKYDGKRKIVSVSTDQKEIFLIFRNNRYPDRTLNYYGCLFDDTLTPITQEMDLGQWKNGLHIYYNQVLVRLDPGKVEVRIIDPSSSHAHPPILEFEHNNADQNFSTVALNNEWIIIASSASPRIGASGNGRIYVMRICRHREGADEVVIEKYTNFEAHTQSITGIRIQDTQFIVCGGNQFFLYDFGGVGNKLSPSMSSQKFDKPLSWAIFCDGGKKQSYLTKSETQNPITSKHFVITEYDKSVYLFSIQGDGQASTLNCILEQKCDFIATWAWLTHNRFYIIARNSDLIIWDEIKCKTEPIEQRSSEGIALYEIGRGRAIWYMEEERP